MINYQTNQVQFPVIIVKVITDNIKLFWKTGVVYNWEQAACLYFKVNLTNCNLITG